MEEQPRDPRFVPIEGSLNFRDFGGYQTRDGGVVKKGKLSRCGSLSFIPDHAYDDFAKLDIGVICDSKGKYSNQTKGCPDGTYTWDTNGRLINVWDGEAIIEGLEGLAAFAAAFFACCCGVVLLIIGIVLAFVLQEEDTKQYYQSNNQDTTSSSSGAKGWDERDDYIHKEKGDEEVPEKSEIATPESEDKKDEKQRSGEYKPPPPPEY